MERVEWVRKMLEKGYVSATALAAEVRSLESAQLEVVSAQKDMVAASKQLQNAQSELAH